MPVVSRAGDRRAAAPRSTASTGCAAPPAAAAGSRRSRTRPVVPPIVTLSNECSSPTRNSSSSAGASALRRDRLTASPASVVAVVEPVGRLRAGTRGRLGDQRKPDLLGECERLAPGCGPGGAARRGCRPACSTVFIRALSRTLSAVATSMPSMPRASRAWASGTWSCSSAPTTRSTRPICRLRPRTAPGDLARVERVVHPPVAGQLLAQRRRQPSAVCMVTTPSAPGQRPRRPRTARWPRAGTARRKRLPPCRDATARRRGVRRGIVSAQSRERAAGGRTRLPS